MQRYFVAKGDRAGAAVIVEGLPTSTYQGADECASSCRPST